MRSKPVWIGTATLCCALALIAGKKKNPDDITQTLDLPKDPPSVAVGETRRLTFSVSPLSGKGLLTQQTRDALKIVMKENGGVPAVHIRAFVAGSGDVRRVPQIVSEVFTEKKLPLPSVSVIRAGGLPVENAQVALEVVSVAKKDTNAGDLRFLTGEQAIGPDPAGPVRPLLDKALDSFAARLNGASPLAVTCFVSQLGRPGELASAVSKRFPGIPIDLVQPQRLPWQALAACEGVAHGGSASSSKLAFTGTRVAFGGQEKDALLAFQRLDKDLAEAGASPSDVLLTNVYSLSDGTSKMVRQLRSAPTLSQLLVFEGLASIDAGFAVDAVAAVPR